MKANEYRRNQVRAWQSEIKIAMDRYQLKERKYLRRVAALDTVSTILASTGVILSALTLAALLVATIGVSSASTAAGVFGIIAKKDFFVR